MNRLDLNLEIQLSISSPKMTHTDPVLVRARQCLTFDTQTVHHYVGRKNAWKKTKLIHYGHLNKPHVRKLPITNLPSSVRSRSVHKMQKRVLRRMEKTGFSNAWIVANFEIAGYGRDIPLRETFRQLFKNIRSM